MRRRLLFTVITVLLVIVATTGTTGALWRDEASIDAGTVTTGSLELLAGGVPDSYLFRALSAGNIAPGDSVSAPLTITNSGSTNLVYKLESVSIGSADTAASSAASGELASALTLLVTDDAICDGTAVGSGVSTLYQGSLSGATYTGKQLAPSSSAALCITVGLSEAAPATASAGAVSATFIFRGDQVQ